MDNDFLKGWLIFNFICRIFLRFYLTKPKEIGTSTNSDQWCGSRYLSWGILTPTQVCILKIRIYFFRPMKGCYIFNCIWRVYLRIWQNQRNLLTSADNDRWWGSRYPGWGILTPTQVYILKIWRKNGFIQTNRFNFITMISWKNATVWYNSGFYWPLKTTNWVGVKIPRLGYLDPHPWFQAKYVIFFIFKPMELILLQE